MSNGGEPPTPRRPTSWRWVFRSLLFLIVVGLAGGLWCAYDGISASLHAESGLHATRLTIQAVEEYVKKHDGAWPRSWKELEQSSTKIKDVYDWTQGSGNIDNFVSVDFGANPDRLAKQTEEDFTAIKPVGPYYGSYRIEVPFLLEALRQTRGPQPKHFNDKNATAK